MKLYTYIGGSIIIIIILFVAILGNSKTTINDIKTLHQFGIFLAEEIAVSTKGEAVIFDLPPEKSPSFDGQKLYGAVLPMTGSDMSKFAHAITDAYHDLEDLGIERVYTWKEVPGYPADRQLMAKVMLSHYSNSGRIMTADLLLEVQEGYITILPSYHE